MRLQVLQLPGPEGERPFVLVFDECKPEDLPPGEGWAEFKSEIGCSGVLVVATKVEIL